MKIKHVKHSAVVASEHKYAFHENVTFDFCAEKCIPSYISCWAQLFHATNAYAR